MGLDFMVIKVANENQYFVLYPTGLKVKIDEETFKWYDGYNEAIKGYEAEMLEIINYYKKITGVIGEL